MDLLAGFAVDVFAFAYNLMRKSNVLILRTSALRQRKSYERLKLRGLMKVPDLVVNTQWSSCHRSSAVGLRPVGAGGSIAQRCIGRRAGAGHRRRLHLWTETDARLRWATRLRP